MQLHRRGQLQQLQKKAASHTKTGGERSGEERKKIRREKGLYHSIADACHCLVAAAAAAAAIAMDATMTFSFTTSKEKWMLLTHTLIQFLISRW